MQDKNTREIDVLQLIKTLWHRAWIIILVTAVSGLSAFGYTRFFITPLYDAGVKFYVNNSAISIDKASVSLSSGDITAAKNLVDTYIVILKTRTTVSLILEETGLDYSYEQVIGMLSAAAVNSTEIFEVKVTNANPKEAVLIANAIADVLPDRISDIIANSSARIVDYAVETGRQISPNYTNNTALGMILGFIVSSGLICIISIFNDRITSEDDLPTNGKYPVLAVVPDIYGKHNDSNKKSYYTSYSQSGSETGRERGGKR